MKSGPNDSWGNGGCLSDLNSSCSFQTERDLTWIFHCQSQKNQARFLVPFHQSIKAWNQISDKRDMKSGPNDSWGNGGCFSCVEFKLFISNWKRVDLYFSMPKPKKSSSFFSSLPSKHQSMKPNLRQKGSWNQVPMITASLRKWWVFLMRWIQVVHFKLKESWPLFSNAKAKNNQSSFFSSSSTKASKHETKSQTKGTWNQVPMTAEEMVGVSLTWIQVVHFKLKESWPLFSTAKAKKIKLVF